MRSAATSTTADVWQTVPAGSSATARASVVLSAPEGATAAWFASTAEPDCPVVAPGPLMGEPAGVLRSTSL
ncbi:hypothetical protein ACVI1N_003687 [Sinorhizobium medicae]